MIPEDILKSLAIRTESRIVLLVMDGVGGLAMNGRTELEAADTPNLNRLAVEGACGLTIPISHGITPGSGPSHLALFGYDPLKYEIGRGVLEALGVGLEMTDRDVAARGNFASLANGVISDRRAGRIPTAKNEELIALLKKAIPTVGDCEVILEHGKEHRFTMMLRGDDLHGNIADADPQKVGLKPVPPQPLDEASKRAAGLFAECIQRANEALADHRPANTILLRGFARYPSIPSMEELFKLNPAAIASYPMYRGLAQLVGMAVLATGETLRDEVTTLRENYEKHDFFYLHVKKTDSNGEDGNFDAKVVEIEKFDKLLPSVLALEPDVIAVTGDHSTPALLKGHSWHPNPFLLWSPYCRVDDTKRFTEAECARGCLGQFPAVDAMPLMLAHALKLEKFGA